jgi:hypothetical protein
MNWYRPPSSQQVWSAFWSNGVHEPTEERSTCLSAWRAISLERGYCFSRRCGRSSATLSAALTELRSPDRLEVADYDREAGTSMVRGKGNRERLAHLGDASQAALEVSLSVRRFWPGPLFVPINKGGKLGTVSMSGQSMLYIARQRTLQASVAAFLASRFATNVHRRSPGCRRGSEHGPAAGRPCPDPDDRALPSSDICPG